MKSLIAICIGTALFVVVSWGSYATSLSMWPAEPARARNVHVLAAFAGGVIAAYLACRIRRSSLVPAIVCAAIAALTWLGSCLYLEAYGWGTAVLGLVSTVLGCAVGLGGYLLRHYRYSI